MKQYVFTIHGSARTNVLWERYAGVLGLCFGTRSPLCRRGRRSNVSRGDTRYGLLMLGKSRGC